MLISSETLQYRPVLFYVFIHLSSQPDISNCRYYPLIKNNYKNSNGNWLLSPINRWRHAIRTLYILAYHWDFAPLLACFISSSFLLNNNIFGYLYQGIFFFSLIFKSWEWCGKHSHTVRRTPHSDAKYMRSISSVDVCVWLNF